MVGRKLEKYVIMEINQALFCFMLGVASVLSQQCLSRDYGFGGTVCVCNSEHCDRYEEITKIEPGKFLKYTSNLAGLRLQKEEGTLNGSDTNPAHRIKIREKVLYQTIDGFGGAFTDSTCLNILSLDENLQNEILRGYFSKEGIEYNIGRVPMAASDFSTHSYTYHDQEDVTLSNFSLASEDYELKIPMIKRARALTNDSLHLFFSTWIAPLWMKFNDAYSGNEGYIEKEYYQVWADYFIKFLDDYAAANVTFWGMTTGNEPFTATYNGPLPTVEWNSTEMAVWVHNNLGPNIRNSSYSDIKIMTLDDQRAHLPAYIDEVFEDETAKNYIDGTAVHWYSDSVTPANRLTETHDKYPDKFILGTEACNGMGKFPSDNHVQLGLWSNGEKYAGSIIQDLSNWVTGWVDWNMALDTIGGPSYINNSLDSPVIVNATANEFYRQPMFYALGHFSKFVPRGSLRIYSDPTNNQIPLIAFIRPDDGVVVVILNETEEDVSISIEDDNEGKIDLDLSAHSITSVIYWP